MKVQIIQVPYDSGHRGLRMGAGPEYFVNHGLEEALRECDYDVGVECIEADDSFRAEIKTTFELYGTLAKRVARAYRRGAFPLVLSGNCGSSLGTVSGVDIDQLAIIWFDSHGDFNTPETTETGFLDGMGLATAAGLSWKKMAGSIPNFRPISARNILQVGGRDYYKDEQALFEQSGGTIVNAEAVRQAGVRKALRPALEALKDHASRVYLHFDLDVIDPKIAPANEYAAHGGLTPAQVRQAIQMISERFTICATGIAAYDPQCDEDHKILKIGIKIMKTILASVKAQACLTSL